MDLEILGWDGYFNSKFEEYSKFGFEPARIIVEHKERYKIFTQYGEMPAEVTGKFMHLSETSSEYPKTGDWVAVSVFKDENKAIIHHVVERKTKFSRKQAGELTEEQVIAANIDSIFIVQGLDDNYNPARLQRYATAVSACSIEPIILLNKTDIAENLDSKLSEVTELLKGITVLKISAKTGKGFDDLNSFIKKAKTYAFVGSSGAGKSSIINRISGVDVAATNEVREKDSKGKHTTTARELFILNSGGLLIDTPGMRELQLWSEDGSIGSGFDDIDVFAAQCKFADCNHETEPECAILKAIEDGTLEKKRYDQYLKLKREAFHMLAKVDEKAALEKRKKDKDFGKMYKSVMKCKKGKKKYKL